MDFYYYFFKLVTKNLKATKKTFKGFHDTVRNCPGVEQGIPIFFFVTHPY